MPATIYDVRYPSQLQRVLSRIPEGRRTVLFFIADTDVESGWSWCSGEGREGRVRWIEAYA